MNYLGITFTHPWLLLLIILAFITTIIPYLRLSKKYRRTRNRILSMTLHFITLTFAILILSGIKFEYDEKNDKNEIILLVDVSDTTEDVCNERDSFVSTALDYGKYDGYKVGVVVFGFDQKYAVPLTTNVSGIYDKYCDYLDNKELPDTSASDIAAALTYTKGLFSNPKTSKIVLVTDGKETDEKATNVIRACAAQGTKIDVAHLYADSINDVEILGVSLPKTHVSINENIELTTDIKSNVNTSCTVQFYDNGELFDCKGNKVDASDNTSEINVGNGVNNTTITHKFTEYGLHELKVVLTQIGDDGLTQNNEYVTYLDIQKYSKVLLLARDDSEGEVIKNILLEQEFEVTKEIISNDESELDEMFPTSVEDLRQYDQVVLNNVANKDMPEGFIDLLNSYVSIYGGGLLTIGGDEGDENPNLYNREDLFGTTYQQMLPIQAIDYTPPVAVMVIVDTSGSMSTTDNGKSRIEWAKDGAMSCMKALTERDYMGLMTLDENFSTILQLTPRTQETTIKNAIGSIGDATGGTVFWSAIEKASQALISLTNIDKRHIVIISDGMPSDSQTEYGAYVEKYYKDKGITVSIIGIGLSEGSSYYNDMLKTVRICTPEGGNPETDCEGHLYALKSASDIVKAMRNDLTAPEIKDVDYGDFTPSAVDKFSSLMNGIISYDEDKKETNLLSDISINKFYGTKVRTSANTILKGPYNVPIYAQWKYGEGMVGSFLVDFDTMTTEKEGKFTLVESEGGKLFIQNVVTNLMPTKDIRPSDITADLSSDNYINELNIYSTLGKNEKIEGTITRCDVVNDEVVEISLNNSVSGSVSELGLYVTTNLSKSNKYSRCVFVLKDSGVYKITLNKYDSDGNVISTYSMYKEFAYSKEYDSLYEYSEAELSENMAKLAEKGNGVLIEDNDNPEEIFVGFITSLHKSFDPRYMLMIIAILLFLLDIVVRKFKFKWIHEIIRDRKEEK